MSDNALLAVRGVGKRFGPLQALADVDADFRAGEVHAILGENGAGKSTLMNVLYGLLRPDEGTVRLDGECVRFDRPDAARQAGIGMVHQDFALVDALSVAENLALALSRPGDLLCDTESVAAAATRLAEEIGLAIGDPSLPAGALSVGERQRVEIIKALSGNTRVLILDEPTAVLTPAETDHLFQVLDGLRERGVAVLFISHKLREVMAIADRVTVLRRGRVVVTRGRAEVDENSLAEHMFGNVLPPVSRLERDDCVEPNPRLSVSGLCLSNPSAAPGLRDINVKVGGGEVLGIAGVDGNGQSELFDVLVGLRVPNSGVISVDGKPPAKACPEAVMALGVGHIPPDRQRQGLVLQASVSDNVILNRAILRQLACGPFLSPAAVREFAEGLISHHAIQVAESAVPAATLSGGNQQRLVVGRALALDPGVLIAFNPTRGLDVAAARAVYDALDQVSARNAAVLLISTDLDEVLEMSDCVSVLYRGRLSEPMRPPFSVERIGRMMTGLDTP